MKASRVKIVAVLAGGLGQFVLFAGLFNANDTYIVLGCVISVLVAFGMPFFAGRKDTENLALIPFYIGSPSLLLAVMAAMDFLGGGDAHALIFWGGLFCVVYLLGKIGIRASKKTSSS